MLEAGVSIGIAAISAMAILTQRLHNRIHELDRRLDGVELRVAQDYITKREMEVIMERMESHMIRIEEKLDKIANKC